MVDKNIIITAGGTREYIDPVRFIGNRSSGKMGIAIVRQAKKIGANVLLIYGYGTEPVPKGIKTIRVVSADDMYKAIKANLKDNSILIMTAAVADFKPARIQKQKIKKGKKNLNLKLVPTIDILKSLSRHKKNQLFIGFALESENIIANAVKKLKEKKLDMIVANNVSAFESDKNEVIIITREGKIKKIPSLPKQKVAQIILKEISNLCATSTL